MDILDFLADQADPVRTFSRWYCDRPTCDGEPHGDHWHWCAHPVEGPHTPTCRHARDKQRPPEGDWFGWLLLAGRGFGKSRCAAEYVISEALASEPAEWAVVARTADDVRKNARDYHAGLIHVSGAGPLNPVTGHGSHVLQYNRHENDIYLDNGAIIHCLSADKPDKLRGYNLAGAWADELAAWKHPETWDMLNMALRQGEHTRLVVTTTPRPTPLIRELVKRCQEQRRAYRLTTGTLFENAPNLAPNFIDEMRGNYAGTRLGRQELTGEVLSDVPGALVTPEMIEKTRLTPDEAEEINFARVVVAVDPAGTYDPEKKSDETGIVVCAKDRTGHGYVLADLSCKAVPEEWARVVVAAFHHYHADRVVAEKNQGGGMVESTIRAVAPFIPYTAVHAKDGKTVRAVPVTALYELGRVHHVGTFSQLEDQLTTWVVTQRHSPDRMDALVHGMTELGLAVLGQGQAFLQFWGNDIKKRAADSAQAIRTERERRAKPKPVRRWVPECSHLWRNGPAGPICVHCGETR